MYESEEECVNDGGEWNEKAEACSLDFRDDDNESRELVGAVIMLAGAVLFVPIVTIPIGFPVFVYGLSRVLFEDTVLRVLFFVGSLLVAAILGFLLGTQVLPGVVEGIGSALKGLFPSPP